MVLEILKYSTSEKKTTFNQWDCESIIKTFIKIKDGFLLSLQTKTKKNLLMKHSVYLQSNNILIQNY